MQNSLLLKEEEKKDQVKIRPVERSDRAGVLSLCGEIFSLDRAKLEKVWSWLFDDNPSVKHQPLQGWVLEANGEIVGHSAVIPQRFSVLGREVVFSFASAFCVSPQYRFHGTRLAFQFLTHEQSALPLTNSGNENTVTIYKFFGCQEIPGMTDNDYLWILRFDRLVWRKMTTGRYARRFAFVRFLAPGLKWIGPVLSHLVWERHRSPYLVERCDHVDEDFNRLWEGLARSYAILAVRDREYLTWRYFKHPERPYQFFAAKSPDGKLVGYVVYRLAGQGAELKNVSIVDLFCDHADSGLVLALIKKVILEARRLGVDAVRIQSVPAPLKQILEKKGFLCRKRNNTTVYRNNCGIPIGVVTNSGSWYCSTADGDADMRIWPFA